VKYVALKFICSNEKFERKVFFVEIAGDTRPISPQRHTFSHNNTFFTLFLDQKCFTLLHNNSFLLSHSRSVALLQAEVSHFYTAKNHFSHIKSIVLSHNTSIKLLSWSCLIILLKKYSQQFYAKLHNSSLIKLLAYRNFLVSSPVVLVSTSDCYG
jgi:hypothetical protein